MDGQLDLDMEYTLQRGSKCPCSMMLGRWRKMLQMALQMTEESADDDSR